MLEEDAQKIRHRGKENKKMVILRRQKVRSTVIFRRRGSTWVENKSYRKTCIRINREKIVKFSKILVFPSISTYGMGRRT